jgi:hypothetical protein
VHHVLREDVAELMRQLFVEKRTPEEIDAQREGLVALSLWPADRDLFEERIAFEAAHAGGFYSPTRRVIYLVVPDAASHRLLGPLMGLGAQPLPFELIAAHEYVHALQYAAYPWLLDTRALGSHADAAWAIQAAIEGDATHYAFETMRQLLPQPPPLPEPEEVIRSYREAARTDPGDGVPALLRSMTGFLYVYGYRLSRAEGPRLLEAPPVSTEQVLHPERRREPFLAMDLGEGVGALPPGCVATAENAAGELLISLLLGEQGTESSSSPSEGWRGDRFLAARCGERRELFWLTAWDSEADAREFAAAYEAIASAAAARAELSAPAHVVRDGREVRIWSPGLAEAAESLAERARCREVATLEDLRPGARARLTPEATAPIPRCSSR